MGGMCPVINCDYPYQLFWQGIPIPNIQIKLLSCLKETQRAMIHINIVVSWYGSKSLDPTKLGLFKNDQRP